MTLTVFVVAATAVNVTVNVPVEIVASNDPNEAAPVNKSPYVVVYTVAPSCIINISSISYVDAVESTIMAMYLTARNDDVAQLSTAVAVVVETAVDATAV